MSRPKLILMMWVLSLPYSFLHVHVSRGLKNGILVAGKGTKLGSQWETSRGAEQLDSLSLEPVTGNSAIVCAEEVMSLFSGKNRAANVSVSRAKELLACIRPLAPNPPIHLQQVSVSLAERFQNVQRKTGSSLRQGSYEDLVRFNENFVASQSNDGVGLAHESRDVLERLIQWPPSSVLDLAKRTVEFGGDPSVLLSALNPTKYQVPNVEGSFAEKCQLAKYEYGQRFQNKEITSYMAFLFHAIAVLAPSVGFNVSLSRFDLFHGHIFNSYDSRRLGILFHAREYPAFDDKIFPVNLGYCQKGSPVPYDASMDLRNILWLAPLATCTDTGKCSDKWLASGGLLVLDAKEGGVIYRELVPDYLDVVRTISEDEFGDVAADVNYLSLPNVVPENRVFIC